MVTKAVRLGLLLGLILALSACAFYLSAFPMSLTQVLATKNLSTLLVGGTGNNYRPFVVTSGSQDFVILACNIPGLDPRIIVMDSGLNEITSYTNTELNGFASTLSSGIIMSFSGSWVMADGSGNIVAGNLVFTPPFTETAATSYLPDNNGLNFPSFTSVAGGDDYINFSTNSSGQLTYTDVTSPSPWSGGTYIQFPVALGGASGIQYNSQGAFNVNDSQVVLVFNTNSSSSTYFVSVPLAAFPNPGTIFSSSHPSTAISNLESSSIGFAGNCLVAYSYDSQTLNRYDLSFNLIDQVTFSQLHNEQLMFSYRQSGGFFVTFDPSTLQLTKYATWW